MSKEMLKKVSSRNVFNLRIVFDAPITDIDADGNDVPTDEFLIMFVDHTHMIVHTDGRILSAW